MSRVSVVLSAYNSGKYIGESIESILKQSYKDLELIVVDGSSKDNTDEVLKRYEDDPRLIYTKTSNKGISFGRNHGIKMAQGDLIALSDGDDIFLKDKILKMVNFFKKYNKYDICYTNATYFNSYTKEEVLSTYYHFSGDIFYYIKRSNFIHPSTVMVRKQVLKENLFDESIPPHEDWELVLRMAFKGFRFGFIKEPLTKIRVIKKSVSTDLKGMEAGRKVVGLKGREYWKKFKKERSFTSLVGIKAALRYLKFKINAFFINFPKSKRFNRPIARELLKG